ncbi:hypothetical protein EFL95_06215 [Nocardioides marmorisolisilvae]|uniref:Glycosyltransferase RgtA/B/C/D-like domain-containing protein n=1 Tax=Nocardioides marmorisolisilvae TaxID=1542737 RepID=A0A3N0DSQ8_9ACTN|nr:hypothetical protein EFL95_06215 [Nocardioides marmorisolisilvae]
MLVVCTVLAVLGAFRAGISTDEPIHVMRLRNYFDNGWYALDWDYDGKGPGSDGTNTFVYAPVAMLLLHAWSVLFGVEGWNHVSGSAHAYDVRHLGVVVMGLVGLAAVAAIGRVLLRHWGWGVVSASILAAIPMWTGHEMFNVKDIPVATGYTLATLGLMLFVRAERPGRRLAAARAFCLFAGLVLAMGTRPGMWPGLVGVVAVAIAGIWLAAGPRRPAVLTTVELGAVCVAAGAALVAIYPKLFGDPFRALPRTTEGSSKFRDGVPPDRLYVPAHLASEIPTLLLFFILTGLVLGGLLVAQRWRTDPVIAARVGLVGFQAAAMPVVAMLVGSDLYNDLRQLLFSGPASAVLGAYGIAWWLQRPRLRTRRLVAVAAVAGLLLPLVDQITLQPYQVTYANLASDVAAGLTHADDAHPGSDFWRVSIPELIEAQPLNHQLLCKATVSKETDRAFRFINGGQYSTSRSLDCREEANGPLAPEGLTVNRAPGDRVYDAVFLKEAPPNCTPLNKVTRWRHGFDVTLTVLARCSNDPPIMPPEGVYADSTALATAQLRDLWRFAVDGWERWPTRFSLQARAPQAWISFRPGGQCRVYGCTLQISGYGPSDLTARVNGDLVRVQRTPQAIGVPISVEEAGNPHGIWVSLRRASGGTLGVTMTGLSERELDQDHLKPTEGQR